MLALPQRLPRLSIGSGMLVLLVAIYVFAAFNRNFWTREVAYYGTSLEGAAFVAAYLCLVLAGLFALRLPYLIRPVLILSIAVAGTAAYFADTYGVIVTRDMIDTIVTTTGNESRQYLTLDLLRHMLLMVLLPAIAVAWFRIRPQPVLRMVATNAAIVTTCLVGSAILVAAYFPGIASTVRERGDILDSANPTGPATAMVKFVARLWIDRSVVLAPLGRDAREALPAGEGRKPAITVLVVGETARADHFSLNGYGRDTNPQLAKRGVISFRDVTSCGTLTSVSLPCMFSVYPRDSFSDRRARSTENLMDVLSHGGLRTAWWDNNTGDKGIASRIDYANLAGGTAQFSCPRDECRDDVLLSGLGGFLDTVDRDTVLVLHQVGSHGPAYYLRYPPEAARFQPECRSAHLSACAPASIVNAYDNTILYTDSILAGIIDALHARSDRLDGAMLYLSDHGESLGEDGLYLHGTPYVIAPAAQTHVPMVAWISDALGIRNGIDAACLRRAAAQNAYSHDNLFHSMLGLMSIETSVYDPALDLFAPCRVAAAVAPAGDAARP